MLDGKPVELRSSALDDHGAVDEIHDHVRFRTCGELDFFRKNPGRFLEDGRIVQVDGKEVLRLGPRGGCQAQKRKHRERE